MRHLRSTTLLVCGLLFPVAHSQIFKVAEMNSTQIAALDRAHTAVLITDGIVEEHGPYLPTFIDGYLDEAVTQELARAIVARPGWSVVLFPTIPLGTAPANIIGRKYVFPGSFNISQSTMRDVFMDLADRLGEQGFRFVFILDSHGGPPNSVALDAASDYFHDTYHGEMVHLLGVMPVVEAGSKALETMLTSRLQAENGLSVHADALEQAQGLFLRPDLVSPTYKFAPPHPGVSFPELTQQAEKKDWPGYLGAPSYATAALGAASFHDTLAVATQLALGVLDGKVDPRKLPRYGETMMPMTESIETSLAKHEAELAEKHQQWLRSHRAIITTHNR